MTRFSMAIVCALACTTTVPAGDATPEPLAASFDQPIGAICRAAESVLCAGGIGICHDNVCCAFCNAIDLPHCRPGTIEVHDTIGDRKICLCSPE